MPKIPCPSPSSCLVASESMSHPNDSHVLPAGFVTALVVAALFAGFLVVDQMHWWQLKPDYAFGWLVPVFVGYIVYERWGRIGRMVRSGGDSPLTASTRRIVSVLAGAALIGGLFVFMLGAAYRAGSGVSQPGSLALALGFFGVLLGIIYFNTPPGWVAGGASGRPWTALWADAQVRTTALFFFPAGIWVLSAPLVTAVENALSLFLLNKVISVVFFVFGLLGYPLVQQGNVLILPMGQVGVADACSGIRSLTACLFAGSFLAAVFLEKFWQKILLVCMAMVFAFLTNLLRSLFLAAWAYAYGSDAIEGTLHDATGFAVLGLTSLGLFALLPLFNVANWRRWFGLDAPAPATP